MSAADLARRFRVPGVVEFAKNEHGLVKAAVSCGGMTGELYLQGAQVTAWQPPGAAPVIFTGSHAVFAPGKAIRGGIPVIVPWFGPHPTDPKAPQHGLVRTAPWRLDKVDAGEAAVTFELSLAIDGFAVDYRVAFGHALDLALTMRNTGSATAGFEEALHSYFCVSDVARISVAGLEGSAHIDKTAGMARNPSSGEAVTLAKETDSVYLGVAGNLAIRDPGAGRRVVIDKTGAASAIVWNPWAEKAAAMGDLGADNWRGFICVECGNVADNRVHLAPGAAHARTTRITVDAG